MIFKTILKNVVNNFKVQKMYKMNYSDQIIRIIDLYDSLSNTYQLSKKSNKIPLP